MIIIGLLVSLLASAIGAISGIGGGVIIKPALDAAGFGNAAEVSFLSSMTVLAMAIMTLVRSRKSQEKLYNGISAYLAAGGIIGGIIGKLIFDRISTMFSIKTVAVVQSSVLLIIVLIVIVYILNKNKVKSRHIKNPGICLCIGMVLGLTASFLGIGGGPINIIVLYYFFDMQPKTAAINSIFIILFSQISSLVFSLLGNTIPTFDGLTLAAMICGGIGGAIGGGMISKHLSECAVEKLYFGVMVFVGVMCVYNMITG